MAVGSDTEVRPFPQIHVPQEALDDLHRRIVATRWPEKETVADESQGVQLAISSTTTGSPKAGTLRPGNSPSCFQKRFARAFGRCAPPPVVRSGPPLKRGIQVFATIERRA